jgi:hypothetical protein
MQVYIYPAPGDARATMASIYRDPERGAIIPQPPCLLEPCETPFVRSTTPTGLNRLLANASAKDEALSTAPPR